MGYPTTKLHGRVLGSKCDVAQNEDNLQTRIQGLPVSGSLFGDPGTNSLYQLIVYLLSAERDQQLVIHAKLTTPADGDKRRNDRLVVFAPMYMQNAQR